jgi:hypothetical protein
MPATAAAQQVFTIEQAKRTEDDFSVVIRTMEDLSGVPQVQHTSGGAPRQH